jgi:hypothetical protein
MAGTSVDVTLSNRHFENATCKLRWFLEGRGVTGIYNGIGAAAAGSAPGAALFDV